MLLSPQMKIHTQNGTMCTGRTYIFSQVSPSFLRFALGCCQKPQVALEAGLEPGPTLPGLQY